MSCKTGLQEGIKKILNDKLWFDYDVQNEIIRIKDTPIKKKGDKEFKKINKKTSIGVAVSTAKDINKTVENLYPGIGDVVKPGRDETYRGAVLIIANTKQYNLINAKNSEEEYKIIEELKKEREEKELAERESFMLKANQAIDEDGNIVPVENLGEIKVPLKGHWESIAEKMQELFPTIKLNVNSSLEGTVLGQANIKAMTVLIDAAFKNKPDLIYHEYAHHYIAWFRNTPLVQEAIKKWGSEEALVQVIGEQSAKQKGKAWKWWQEFKNWMIGLFSDLNNKDKEELKNIITDAFLQGVDLETGQVGISEQRSRELAERASEGVFNQETNQTLTYEQVEKLFDENPEIANQVYEELGIERKLRNQKDVDLRAKYFKNGNITTDTQILTDISNSKHPLAKVAKHLIPYTQGVKVELLPTEFTMEFDRVGTDGKVSKMKAGAHAFDDKIEIAEFATFKGKGSEVTIIHEVLHVLTKRYLRKNSAANSSLYKEFENLFEEAKNALPDTYALTNLDEFLVTLFTDAKFIKDLSEIPAKQPTKYKNLMEEIFTHILKLFGFKQNTSLYSNAFAVATNIIQEQYDYDQEALRFNNEISEYLQGMDESIALEYDNLLSSQKQQAIEYYIEKQQNQSQKFSLAEKLEAPCEGGPNI